MDFTSTTLETENSTEKICQWYLKLYTQQTLYFLPFILSGVYEYFFFYFLDKPFPDNSEYKNNFFFLQTLWNQIIDIVHPCQESM